jgi:hypothetical protein
MVDYVLENYSLSKENLNDRRARVVNQHSYTESDLADAIVRRNMGISRPEALAMLEALSEIQLEWLRAGNSVNLRLVHVRPSVPGTYEEGEYPKEIAFRATVSKELNKVAKTVPLRHVEPVSPIGIEFVRDIKSNTSNDKVTSGGTVKITGHRLKIAGKEPIVGIQFISATDPGTTYSVPATDIIVNNPSELVITAPQMVLDETVLLKIATQYAGSVLLKTPRSVTFNKELTVVE